MAKAAGREMDALDREAPSPLKLISLSLFAFTLNVVFTSLGVVILPMEAHRLNAQYESVLLSAMIATVTVTHLCSPLFGYMSDTYESPFGRRRPFLLAGTVLSVAGMVTLAEADSWASPAVFFLALFAASLALDIIAAVHVGLVPDLLSKDSSGAASGVMSALQFLGNVVAMALVAAPKYGEPPGVYLVISVMLLATCVLVCLGAREQPSVAPPAANAQDAEEAQLLTDARMPEESFWSKVRKEYQLSPSNPEERDFFFITVSRMFYYAAGSIQGFLLFYLRDNFGGVQDDLSLHVSEQLHKRLGTAPSTESKGLHALNPTSNSKGHVILVAVLALSVAVVTALVVGPLSDRTGRRKAPVYASSMVMAATFVLFGAALYVPPEQGIYMAYSAAVLFGAGAGAFQSVDYALALDCLPPGPRSASRLGLWGVCAFIGSSLGSAIFGVALMLGGRVKHEETHDWGFSRVGYLVMLSFAAIFACATAVPIGLVEKAK